MDYFQIILPAARMFATVAHAGQKRKYTGEPYITHPEHVAGIAMTLLPELAAVVGVLSYLHDTVEDTDVTLERIRGTFGEYVARGVAALTKDDTAGKNRAEKLKLYAEQLESADMEVQVVKAADIMSNLSSVAVHDPKFGVTYAREKMEEASYLKKLPEAIAIELRAAIETALNDSEKARVQAALGEKEGKL